MRTRNHARSSCSCRSSDLGTETEHIRREDDAAIKATPRTGALDTDKDGPGIVAPQVCEKHFSLSSRYDPDNKQLALSEATEATEDTLYTVHAERLAPSNEIVKRVCDDELHHIRL